MPGGDTFVLFHIGERRFALSSSLINELAPPVRLHKFPATSARVSGVIVRRGKIVPVYDFRAFFGGKRSSANLFYLVARCEAGDSSDLCAFPVNGECELLSGEIQPPTSITPEYISGAIAVGEKQFEVLNLDALVASNASLAIEPVPHGAQR
jgi:chemotaxis signal transduction protein